MGVVRWESQRLVDACFELLGDDVLEPFRFVVDVVHVEAECFREIELQQPVVADHFQSHSFGEGVRRDDAGEMDYVVGLRPGAVQRLGGGRPPDSRLGPKDRNAVPDRASRHRLLRPARVRRRARLCTRVHRDPSGIGQTS